jgi:hypothetical protein
MTHYIAHPTTIHISIAILLLPRCVPARLQAIVAHLRAVANTFVVGRSERRLYVLVARLECDGASPVAGANNATTGHRMGPQRLVHRHQGRRQGQRRRAQEPG